MANSVLLIQIKLTEGKTSYRSELLKNVFASNGANLITVFIRLSAQGAYLIFGLSGWALIRGGRLFEAGRLLNFHHLQ